MKKPDTAPKGMGFLEWLMLAFVVLKVAHVINWSWWLVLVPLWIILALIVFVAIIEAVADR